MVSFFLNIKKTMIIIKKIMQLFVVHVASNDDEPINIEKITVKLMTRARVLIMIIN